MNLPPLQLRMEATPGADIADCFDQALELALQIKAVIVFDFNGVHCGVRPSDFKHSESKDWFIAAYHRALNKDVQVKIAYANP